MISLPTRTSAEDALLDEALDWVIRLKGGAPTRDDVDALYQTALKVGYLPSTTPRDAEWGERYFHLTDPDGHELSFARPLRSL